jgi:hypothetical protein
MQINEINTNYVIFCDLDGVLADFEKAAKEITGKDYNAQPPKVFWPQIARTKDFYANLDTMDNLKLWDYIKKYKPSILTGLPQGNWAEPQKRQWCARHLGKYVKVITGWARDKHTFAAPNHILIDDNARNIKEWETAGGIGIFHTSLQSTIKELKKLKL